MSEEVPEGRCGFVLEPNDVDKDTAEGCEAGSERWYEYSEAACCWRKVWDEEDTDRCVWHAEIDGKPVDELAEARGHRPERFDGTHLRKAEPRDTISFEGCRMWGADLKEADLKGANFQSTDLKCAFSVRANFESANLSDAALDMGDFRWANLHSVDLSNANLRGATLFDATLNEGKLWAAVLEDACLRGVDLNDANLALANIIDANLSEATAKDADFDDANLWNVDLCDANLEGADLRGTNLKEANFLRSDLENMNSKDADFRLANFKHANLKSSNLRHASLVGVNLADVNLTGAILRDADLKAATLEDAILTRTDLRGADLEYAELYQTLFSDVRMNNRTEFGATCQYEARDIEPQIDDGDSDITPLEAAAWTYRRIQTLHEENALAQDAREYHVKKAEAYRKLRWREFADVWSQPHQKPKKWSLALIRALTYSINGRVSRHGESPFRVLNVSFLVILSSAVLYPLVGGIEQLPTPGGTAVVEFGLLPSIPIPLPGPIADLGTSLYFSVVTFTTLGSGTLQPASGAAQALATVESFVGALLMALLVFVLGRRATW